MIMNIRKIALDIIILPSLFLLLVIVMSVFPKPPVIILGVFGGLILLFIISIRFGLFEDVELPAVQTEPNISIESAIDQVHKLFGLANEEVIIASGGLNEKMWNQDKLLDDLAFLIKRNVDIQFLTGPDLNFAKDSRLYRFLEFNLKEALVKMYILPNWPPTHFIIIDAAHVRLENRHDINTIDREAKILKYAGALAARAKIRYEDYRMNADMITLNDFYKLNFKDSPNVLL